MKMNYNQLSVAPTPEAPKLPFDEVGYPDAIAAVAESCPEVADKESLLRRATARLIDQYKPSADFFEAPDNALALLFASSLVVFAEDATDKTVNKTKYDNLVADSYAWIVFGDYSSVRTHEDRQQISTLEDDERIALFHRYENPDLSEKFASWMEESETLAKVRQELDIDASAARRFVPIVLRAGRQIHFGGLGMAKGSPDMSSQFAAWENDAAQFMLEQGSHPDDKLPYAWVSTLNDEKYLCLPEPLAAALVTPETVGFEDDGILAQRLGALASHEYVHVQRSLQLRGPAGSGKTSGLGGLLTEYQAEVFSGFNFRSVYPETYNLNNLLNVVTGVELSEMIKQHSQGETYDRTDFYIGSINSIGLVATAKLAGSMLRDHVKFQSRKAERQLNDLLLEYPFTDELLAQKGWTAINALYVRNDEPMSDKQQEYWREKLRKVRKF